MKNPNGCQILGDGQHGPGVGPSRHGDDGDLWKAPAELADSFQAVSDIGMYRSVMTKSAGLVRYRSTPSLPSASQDDLVASRLESLLQHRPHVRVVVYDKDSRHWLSLQCARPLRICK